MSTYCIQRVPVDIPQLKDINENISKNHLAHEIISTSQYYARDFVCAAISLKIAIFILDKLYIYIFLKNMSLSIAENSMKTGAVVFELIANTQTDAAKDFLIICSDCFLFFTQNNPTVIINYEYKGVHNLT